MYSSTSNFWKVAACLPLAASALGASAQAVALPSESGQQETSNWTFHHEHVLGTSLEITVRAENGAQAHDAEAAVLAMFDHDDAILSTWRADSEVSRWSKTRFEPVAVSSELYAVLASFDHWRERTGGALDASVGAATRLWQNATTEGRVPTASEIAMTVEAMGQPHWSLDAQRGTATRLSDVPLALASFTKNYISSRAADAALKAGASGVTLNVGGDVIVRGDMMQLVAVANPLAHAETDQALQYLAVRDRAVATSGSYRRGFSFEDAGTAAPQYSHLIDPRVALPVNHVLSSTVVARDAMTAGALATAFSVLSLEETRRLAASMPDAQYLLVMADGREIKSARWPAAAGLQTVGVERGPAKKAVAPAAGVWDAAYELNLDLNLPRIEDARYRRPYVAVWIEDADHFPVRTLALWTQNPRWLSDLKQWYREDQVRSMAEGTDVSRTVSSATRPPGRYTLKWDGKDNEGKLVKAGKYTICVEAAREHGGYDIQRHELALEGRPQQVTLPAAKELGAVSLDYRKR